MTRRGIRSPDPRGGYRRPVGERLGLVRLSATGCRPWRAWRPVRPRDVAAWAGDPLETRAVLLALAVAIPTALTTHPTEDSTAAAVAEHLRDVAPLPWLSKYPPCRDCGEPDAGACPDARCRDCDLQHVTSAGACRECLTWLIREEYGGPVAAQHEPGCPLAAAEDCTARSDEELAAVRRARCGWSP